MKRFVKRHNDRIIGIIAGYDRVVFRGTLRSISYVEGLEIFLRSRHVLNKDFGAFSERATRQLREHAREYARRAGRPYLYQASSTASKQTLVQQIIQRDGVRQGLICVIACVEPCRTFKICGNRETKTVDLRSFDGKCEHVYFYFLDRDFGVMHVRLQTWFPFSIQICLNGREWLARQLDRARIGYEKRDNCFTWIERVEQAQRLLDRLWKRKWQRCLDAWARRANCWLQTEDGRQLRGYYWSIRQQEFATDVMFRDGPTLAEICPALQRHAIERFRSHEVLRFLGRRNPARCQGEVCTRLSKRFEGVCIKHRVAENSIKMYDKEGSVLRIETTINNPRWFRVRRRTKRQGQPCIAWLPMRKGIADIGRRAQVSRAANARYLDALSVVGETAPCHRVLDPVTRPVHDQGRCYRPLRPIAPADFGRLEPLQDARFLLHGFRNGELFDHWEDLLADQDLTRKQISGRITRWLALLRAHGLIYRLSGTYRYRLTKTGHQVVTIAASVRQANSLALAA